MAAVFRVSEDVSEEDLNALMQKAIPEISTKTIRILALNFQLLIISFIKLLVSDLTKRKTIYEARMYT